MQFKGLKLVGVQPSNNSEFEFGVFSEGLYVSEGGEKDFFPNDDKTKTRIYRKGDAEKLVGQFFKGGKIVKHETTPYEINGKMVNSISFVVLGEEKEFEIGNQLLRRNDAVIKASGAKLPSVLKAEKAAAEAVAAGGATA